MTNLKSDKLNQINDIYYTVCVNSPAYLGTKADFVDWDEWVINKVEVVCAKLWKNCVIRVSS
jgi:hypothetical protein